VGLHARGLPATPRPLAQRMLRRGAPRTRGRGPHDDDLRRPRVLGCGHRRAGVEGKGRREADDGCRPRTPPSDRSPDRSSERVPQRHPVLRAPRISSRVRGHPLAWPSPRKTEGSDRPTDSRGRSSRPCGDRCEVLRCEPPGAPRPAGDGIPLHVPRGRTWRPAEGIHRRKSKRGRLRDRPVGRRADGHWGRAESLSRPRRSSRLI